MARTLVTGNILRSGSIPTTALGGGVVTSSLQIVASLPTGSLSSSAQVNYPDISNIPGGIASSSTQIKDYLPTGTVSSSTQLPSGIASSSAQVTAYLPTGTVSSSGQISVFNTINGDQLATTGSNTFTAAQTISDTTNSTSYLDGALHVAGGMSVRKDVRISGSMTINGLLTAVSMSTQYVTSSEYVVGTSRITLNDDDNVRFAGLSIIDSGSASPTSASIFWDSLQHRFIYENLSGSAYNSAIIIAGPKHTGSLGDEPTLTSGYIPVATGTDHIDNSVMFQSSSNVGIGTTNPSNPLTVSSTGNTIAPIGLIDTQASGRTWFINNGFPAVGHFSLYDGTAAATRLTIDTSGRLLIGLTSNNTSGPVQALVNGTGTSFQTNPAVFGAVTTVAGREVPMIYGTDGTNTALVSMLSGNMAFFTQGTARLTINSSGNVGIGITNPGVRLHISGSSAGEANIISTIGNLEFYKDATPSRAYGIGMAPVGGSITDDLVFTSYNGSWSEKVRFTNAGRVGIGTTTPTGSLDANGPIVARAAGGFSSDALDNIGTVPFVARLSLDSTFLGAINQYGYQAFAVNIDGSANASNTRGRVDFYTKTDGNWRVALTLNNGSVGIGSTNPGYKLDISGSGDVQQRIGSTGTDAGLMMAGSRSYILYSGNAGSGIGTGNFSVYDATAGLARLTISGSGNIGIGVTNPSSGILQTKDAGIASTNTYLGTGRLRIGGGSDHGSNPVLSVAPGEVQFDAPGVVGGRLLINSSGNVGIGTTNPGVKLDVSGTAGTSAASMRLTNTGTAVGDYAIYQLRQGSSSLWQMFVGANEDTLKFGRSGVGDYLFLASSGNVGIGTTNPAAKLGIQGSSGAGVDGGVLLDLYGGTISAADNGVGISFTRATSQMAYIQAARENASNEAAYLRFATQTSAGTHPERMRITSNGVFLVGTTNTDIGGSVAGTRIAPNGTMAVCFNDASPANYQSPIVADRRNTAGDGLMYGMWRQGIFQSGIGATNTQAITFVTGDGANNVQTERMRIDSLGRVTLPYQPSFKAGRSGTQTYSVNDTIVFNSEFYDIGGHYNASTGIFTAPVSGTYIFTATVLVQSSATGYEYDFNIVTSNETYFGAPGRTEYQAGTSWGDGYIAFGVYHLAYMDANDTAKITFSKFDGGAIYGGTTWTNFAGMLIG